MCVCVVGAHVYVVYVVGTHVCGGYTRVCGVQCVHTCVHLCACLHEAQRKMLSIQLH